MPHFGSALLGQAQAEPAQIIVVNQALFWRTSRPRECPAKYDAVIDEPYNLEDVTNCFKPRAEPGSFLALHRTGVGLVGKLELVPAVAKRRASIRSVTLEAACLTGCSL